MTDCEDCSQARVRTWGIYRSKCSGCAARAIARSLVCWNALHPQGDGNRDALTEMVGRLLPNVAADEARRMVLSWWREDHPKPNTEPKAP